MYKDIYGQEHLYFQIVILNVFKQKMWAQNN